MGWRKPRDKGEKAAAIVKFMGKLGVEVTVVDSLYEPEDITVLRSDGGLLEVEQAEALADFLRGYRIFGG